MSARSWRTIDKRTDEVQLLEALRTNRTKRERQRRFIVEGVRNIDAALAVGWPVVSVLGVAGAPRRSRWAEAVVDRLAASAELVLLAPDLFDALTDRDERPELLLVAEIPRTALDDVEPSPTMLALVLDRIASPGNLGTIVRTADAFGAGVVVTVGHAASPWDPQAVRASTGSLFSVPVAHADGPAEVEAWCRRHGMTIVALDESGTVDLADAAVARPCALLLGNETAGLSQALGAIADVWARIPIGGTASSLNVAVAAGIALYEASRP